MRGLPRQPVVAVGDLCPKHLDAPALLLGFSLQGIKLSHCRYRAFLPAFKGLGRILICLERGLKAGQFRCLLREARFKLASLAFQGRANCGPAVFTRFDAGKFSFSFGKGRLQPVCLIGTVFVSEAFGQTAVRTLHPLKHG